MIRKLKRQEGSMATTTTTTTTTKARQTDSRKDQTFGVKVKTDKATYKALCF